MDSEQNYSQGKLLLLLLLLLLLQIIFSSSYSLPCMVLTVVLFPISSSLITTQAKRKKRRAAMPRHQAAIGKLTERKRRMSTKALATILTRGNAIVGIPAPPASSRLAARQIR